MIAAWYDPARALLATKANVIAWSVADLLIVGIALSIVDLCARSERRGRARLRWAILIATAVAAPGVFLLGNQSEIFVLESVVCGLQLLILVSIAWRDLPLLMRTYEKLSVKNS